MQGLAAKEATGDFEEAAKGSPGPDRAQAGKKRQERLESLSEASAVKKD